MKKKTLTVLIVMVLLCSSIGLYSCGKKEEVVQVSVDDACIELLGKMKIVKDATAFDEERLDNSCDKYQAYEILNTMMGQDGAEVPTSYQGEQITQNDLLALYLKELFQIEIKEAAGENFEAYANELEIKYYFGNKEAEATNNNLISLAYACALYGLDDWKNTKTVFQQMLESGYFNGIDISEFKVAAMDDIFNFGTNKCPATEVYDKYTGRTYYFVDYFGNTYDSPKNIQALGLDSGGKEILLRPYMAQQNNTSDGTGFIFTRYPSGHTYLYNVETQTMKYIDTIYCEDRSGEFMYLAPSDTLYYCKKIDDNYAIYRKNIYSDDEPEKIVDVETGFYIHVTNDEKYASVYATNKYIGDDGKQGFVRIDIENKKVELAASYSIPETYRLPGNNNIVNHIKINPGYPELYFFAHDYLTINLVNVFDRANILNVDTGEAVTIDPGIVPDKFSDDLPVNRLRFCHEGWSENGEYLYLCNYQGVGDHVADGGVIRVNKDGTHRRYIANPGIYERQKLTGKVLGSAHGSASGDDRYFVVDGNYISLINQETDQIFPISYNVIPESHDNPTYHKHPYHAHPTVSRGDTYLVNWGKFYVPEESLDDPKAGTLGVAYFDFTDIDENEAAKGGEVKYNEYVSRLSFEGIACESDIGTYFGKEAIHAKARKFACFNIDTSIVDSINETVTITFDYYDNAAQDMKLIYTKGVENIEDNCYSEDGSAKIACTNTGEWKKAELVISGNFETSGKCGIDFKIGSASSDTYIANIEVKKH